MELSGRTLPCHQRSQPDITHVPWLRLDTAISFKRRLVEGPSAGAGAYAREMTGVTRGDPSLELIGREAERKRLETVLSGLHERGGALLVRGEAGIGKSSLLQHAQERATALGVRTLATVGVESEAELAFAGLDQLLDSVDELIGRLPDRRRHALQAALRIACEFDPDPFLVALAAYQVIRLCAGSGPVLVLVDDAQ